MNTPNSKDLTNFIKGMHGVYGRFIDSACAALESQEEEIRRLKEDNGALLREVEYQRYQKECREPAAVAEYRSGEAAELKNPKQDKY